MELTDSLLHLPAGGQVLLSDNTFQRIGGRLHEVKLPAFQLQRPIEVTRSSIDGQSRRSLEGQSRQRLKGQSRQSLDGQSGEGQSIEASSRRSSLESSVKFAVCHQTQAVTHT